jgi:hypothetical protein
MTLIDFKAIILIGKFENRLLESIRQSDAAFGCPFLDPKQCPMDDKLFSLRCG